MNRIEALCSYIENEDKVVDVGCDQAKLGIMLAGRGINSIASDVSVHVINRAKLTIEKLNLEDKVKLIVSDGLACVNEDVDTLVMAGMGTTTMLDILNNTDLKFKKIITISNNHHDILRFNLNKLGYCVYEEMVINENGKYYNLIVFKEGNYDYSEKELLLGLNHKNKELYHEYLNYLLNKYEKIKLSSKDKNDNIDKYIMLIKETICM